MRHTFLLVLIIVGFNLFYGCRYIPPPPGEPTVMTGSIDNDGDFNPVKAKAGELPKKYLSGIGDEVSFRSGEPFELSISGFDPDYYDLQYNFDSENNSGSIKVVKKIEHPVIHLTKKCQTINISPGPIPEIIVDQSLPKEQVIVTPRYNKSCQFLGYEIRYGSTTRGCKDKERYLNTLGKCRGPKSDFPKNNKNYWSEILFGS